MASVYTTPHKTFDPRAWSGTPTPGKPRPVADPIGPSDMAILYTGLALYAITAAALVFAWLNRKFPPLRAKNLPLTTVMYLSAVIWFFGSCVCNGLIENKGIWRECQVWGIWVNLAFEYVFSCTVIFRIYSLDRIFNQRKTNRGLRYWAPLVAMYCSVLVLCIVSQAVGESNTVKYIDFFKTCHYITHYRYACMSIRWCLSVVIAALTIKIRNIHSSFNEFRESAFFAVLSISTDLETTLVQVLNNKHSLSRSIRGTAAAFDFATGFVAIWILIGYPVINCILRRNEYLEEWLDKLSRDGLRNEYAMEPIMQNSRSGYSKFKHGSLVDTVKETSVAHHPLSDIANDEHSYYLEHQPGSLASSAALRQTDNVSGVDHLPYGYSDMSSEPVRLASISEMGNGGRSRHIL